MKNLLIIVAALIMGIFALPPNRPHHPPMGMGGMMGTMKHHMGGMGMMSLSSFGGGAGCVVTGNKLYANGFYQRDLTAPETTELQQYQAAVQNYKDQMQTVIKQRQDRLREITNNGMFNGRRVSRPQDVAPTVPQPPTAPSFCNANDTTQYIFDGCMVQNNKVYVGNNYARDLSATEVQQLNTFATQMTAYQNYIAASIQKQVQGLFGSNSPFSGMFGPNGPNGPNFNSDNSDQSNDLPDDNGLTTTTTMQSTTTVAPPQAPTPPNFCTAIM